MNIKLRSLSVIMLILVSSMIVMPTSVSAEETVEPTDEDVWFRYNHLWFEHHIVEVKVK